MHVLSAFGNELQLLFVAEGVPNAPVARITSSILSWDVPRSNGQPILHYLVLIE